MLLCCHATISSNLTQEQICILWIRSESTPASSLGWGWFGLKIPIMEGCKLRTKFILIHIIGYTTDSEIKFHKVPNKIFNLKM